MTRLLTLTGAGGSGKTRLALEVAGDLVGAYPDGVRLVELAPLSEPGLVAAGGGRGPGGIGATRASRSSTTLVDDPAIQRKMLLVLDNCEHLVEAAARLVEASLGSCPSLRVLATSREPLGYPARSTGRCRRSPCRSRGGRRRIEELGCAANRRGSSRSGRPTGRSAFALTRENAGAVAEVCRQAGRYPAGHRARGGKDGGAGGGADRRAALGLPRAA